MSKPKIVLCHGCFDVLHTGHIHHLKQAKAFGDQLVVSLTHEDFAKKSLKFSAEFRKEMLESLNFVDQVIITQERTALAAIRQIKPDFYVKGKEYAQLELDRSGDIFPEKAEVEKHGGQLVFTDDEIVFSATKIKDSDIYVDLSEKGFRLPDVLAFIHAVTPLRVCVIGETIIDRWTPVSAEGVSSKSTCPTARVDGSSRDQLGGAYVIARHLKEFVAQVDLITHDFSHQTSEPLDPDIVHHFYTQGALIKERLYQPQLNTKVFELKHFSLNQSYDHNFSLEGYDLVIVADFGHGMLNRAGAKQISETTSGYLAVMAQSNSSNLGFNRVDKYPRAQLYCIDTVELRLCLNLNEQVDFKRHLPDMQKYIEFDRLFTTLGSQGALLYQGQELTAFPALVRHMIDPIGAGDAFFSLASLCGYLGLSPERSLLIASLAGALNTQWLCNDQHITPALLLEAAKKVI
jgi:cytidyltransferase-like protein